MATLTFASLTSPPLSSLRRSPSTHGRFLLLHKSLNCGQRSLLLPITCSSTEPNQNADDSESETASLTPSSSSDLTYKLYAGLGGVGFLETTYLTYLKLTNSNALCLTGGGGGSGSCGDILSSCRFWCSSSAYRNSCLWVSCYSGCAAFDCKEVGFWN